MCLKAIPELSEWLFLFKILKNTVFSPLQMPGWNLQIILFAPAKLIRYYIDYQLYKYNFYKNFSKIFI